MKEIQDSLQKLIGVKFLNSELKDKISNKQLPYMQELDAEVMSIFDSPKASGSRSIFQIQKACENGMMGEIIIRECNTNFIATNKMYHDLAWKDSDIYIEVKRWNPNAIELNRNVYLTKGIVFNTSKYLAIFTYDQDYTWLDRFEIIDRDSMLALNAEERITGDNTYAVKQSGQSFTLYQNTLNNIKRNRQKIEFITNAGRRITKTAEWFDLNCRASKKGLDGGFYIFIND